MSKPILVSACLLGIECRWDGGSRLTSLRPMGDVLPACPEVLAGFGVPRPAIQHDDEGRVRVVETQEDVTDRLAAACNALVETARGLGVKQAVLKERSPSCGSSRVWVNGVLQSGEGLLTTRLRAAGISVRSEPSS